MLRLRNDRREALIVHWLPEGGEARPAGRIAPGKTMTQNTTKGHRFLIEGSNSDLSRTVTVTKAEETVVFAPAE